MSTRQMAGSVAAGILLFLVNAGLFVAGRETAHPARASVGPTPRKAAELRLRQDAATAQLSIERLQWNAETTDLVGHRVENFTIRFAGNGTAFQVSVVLNRQDWAVIDIRPFN
jgi:hypothetical protein